MTSHPFTDLVNGRECTLEIRPGNPPVVIHPGCTNGADVSTQLDAFYCTVCRYNGRVSGAWVIGLLRGPRGG